LSLLPRDICPSTFIKIWNTISLNNKKNKTPLHVEKGRFGLRAAERVGILSAAYKFPNAAYAVLTAGLNKTIDSTVKVQVLCD
jgi:hypothetical protein